LPPGQKKCPACEKPIASRANSCKHCGHVIREPKKREPKKKVYDSPGKGRKQCPKCRKYIPAVVPICSECNHSFETQSAKEIREKLERGEITPEEAQTERARARVKAYDKNGPGRKQCPDCRKFVGYSIEICACGFKFGKYVKPEKKIEERYSGPTKIDIEASVFKRAYNGTATDLLVIAPSGECPVKLTGTDAETVIAWAKKVIDAGQKEELFYSPAALRHFARYFYDVFSGEYAIFCDNLDSWVSEISDGYEE
jgi:hypothetical protein